AHWGKQHAFAMHRESQWSIQKLHNQSDGRYRQDAASLFARYLEDHTGIAELDPSEDFDTRRRRFETPGLDWEKDGPKLPPMPYVVMEMVKGEALHVAMDREWRQPTLKSAKQGKNGSEEPPRMSPREKREVLLQASVALEYLTSFWLMHRDFRGCNLMLAERGTESQECKLKVLDLGVMITCEAVNVLNTNDAVQAFRRRGETEEKRKRYDWLPWEVRAGCDGTGPPVNFASPGHSFDVFSLGVLALHLLVGRTQARNQLDLVAAGDMAADTAAIGLEASLHRRMLGEDSRAEADSRGGVELDQGQLGAASQSEPGAEVEQAEEFEVSALEVALLQTKAQQPTSTGSTVISQEAGDAQDDEVSMIQDVPTISLNSAVRE
ncbi:unnamed protein product, partial [Polarella glacialis]